jgi:hypothetical protein
MCFIRTFSCKRIVYFDHGHPLYYLFLSPTPPFGRSVFYNEGIQLFFTIISILSLMHPKRVLVQSALGPQLDNSQSSPGAPSSS